MALAVTEEQVALAESISGWAERAKVREAARAEIDVPAGSRTGLRPAWWPGVVELGLTGLALSEEVGGSGASVTELAVAVETLGRHIAHGPFVPSAVAGIVLTAARLAAEDAKEIDALLTGLAEGETTGAVALDGSVTAVDAPGGLRLSGDAGLATGLAGGDFLIVGATGPHGEVWAAIDLGDGVTVEAVDSLDVTRPIARVTLDGALVPAERILTGLDAALVRDLFVTIAAAEGAGIARWAQETATAYAKVREQFGRPIGSFQSIKHLCADMLQRSELAAAAAWDAASAASSYLEGENPEEERLQLAVAAASAGAVAVQDAVHNAQDCIQILGGIGFTWEHDAHLSLRRAMAMRALAGGTSRWNAAVSRLGREGLRRHRSIALGDEVEPLREQVRVGHRRAAGRAQGPSQGLRRCRPHRPRTGRSRTASPPAPWSSSPSARSSSAPGCARPTSSSATGRCRRSSSTATRSSASASSPRPCSARSSGASCSPSPAPAPTSRRCDQGHQGRRRLVAAGPEGLDLAGQAGRLGHLPRPYQPRCARSTRASRTSSST